MSKFPWVGQVLVVTTEMPVWVSSIIKDVTLEIGDKIILAARDEDDQLCRIMYGQGTQAWIHLETLVRHTLPTNED